MRVEAIRSTKGASCWLSVDRSMPGGRPRACRSGAPGSLSRVVKESRMAPARPSPMGSTSEAHTGMVLATQSSRESAAAVREGASRSVTWSSHRPASRAACSARPSSRAPIAWSSAWRASRAAVVAAVTSTPFAWAPGENIALIWEVMAATWAGSASAMPMALSCSTTCGGRSRPPLRSRKIRARSSGSPSSPDGPDGVLGSLLTSVSRLFLRGCAVPQPNHARARMVPGRRRTRDRPRPARPEHARRADRSRHPRRDGRAPHRRARGDLHQGPLRGGAARAGHRHPRHARRRVRARRGQRREEL